MATMLASPQANRASSSRPSGPSRVFVTTSLDTKFVAIIPSEEDSSKLTVKWFQGLVQGVHAEEFPEKGPVRCTAISMLDGFRVPKHNTLQDVFGGNERHVFATLVGNATQAASRAASKASKRAVPTPHEQQPPLEIEQNTVTQAPDKCRGLPPSNAQIPQLGASSVGQQVPLPWDPQSIQAQGPPRDVTCCEGRGQTPDHAAAESAGAAVGTKRKAGMAKPSQERDADGKISRAKRCKTASLSAPGSATTLTCSAIAQGQRKKTKGDAVGYQGMPPAGQSPAASGETQLGKRNVRASGSSPGIANPLTADKREVGRQSLGPTAQGRAPELATPQGSTGAHPEPPSRADPQDTPPSARVPPSDGGTPMSQPQPATWGTITLGPAHAARSSTAKSHGASHVTRTPETTNRQTLRGQGGAEAASRPPPPRFHEPTSTAQHSTAQQSTAAPAANHSSECEGEGREGEPEGTQGEGMKASGTTPPLSQQENQDLRSPFPSWRRGPQGGEERADASGGTAITDAARAAMKALSPMVDSMQPAGDLPRRAHPSSSWRQNGVPARSKEPEVSNSTGHRNGSPTPTRSQRGSSPAIPNISKPARVRSLSRSQSRAAANAVSTAPLPASTPSAQKRLHTSAGAAAPSGPSALPAETRSFAGQSSSRGQTQGTPTASRGVLPRALARSPMERERSGEKNASVHSMGGLPGPSAGPSSESDTSGEEHVSPGGKDVSPAQRDGGAGRLTRASSRGVARQGAGDSGVRGEGSWAEKASGPGCAVRRENFNSETRSEPGGAGASAITQGEKPGMTQGEKPGVTQGEKTGITQGEKPGITQGEKPGSTQGEKPGTRLQTRGGVRQRGFAISKGTLIEVSDQEQLQNEASLQSEMPSGRKRARDDISPQAPSSKRRAFGADGARTADQGCASLMPASQGAPGKSRDTVTGAEAEKLAVMPAESVAPTLISDREGASAESSGEGVASGRKDPSAESSGEDVSAEGSGEDATSGREGVSAESGGEDATCSEGTDSAATPAAAQQNVLRSAKSAGNQGEPPKQPRNGESGQQRVLNGAKSAVNVAESPKQTRNGESGQQGVLNRAKSAGNGPEPPNQTRNGENSEDGSSGEGATEEESGSDEGVAAPPAAGHESKAPGNSKAGAPQSVSPKARARGPSNAESLEGARSEEELSGEGGTEEESSSDEESLGENGGSSKARAHGRSNAESSEGQSSEEELSGESGAEEESSSDKEMAAAAGAAARKSEASGPSMGPTPQAGAPKGRARLSGESGTEEESSSEEEAGAPAAPGHKSEALAPAKGPTPPAGAPKGRVRLSGEGGTEEESGSDEEVAAPAARGHNSEALAPAKGPKQKAGGPKSGMRKAQSARPSAAESPEESSGEESPSGESSGEESSDEESADESSDGSGSSSEDEEEGEEEESDESSGAATSSKKGGALVKVPLSKHGADKVAAQMHVQAAKSAVSKPGATKVAAQTEAKAANSAVSKPGATKGAPPKPEGAKGTVLKPGVTKVAPAKAEASKSAVSKPGAAKGAGQTAGASAESSSGDEESSSSGSEASSSEEESAKGAAQTKVQAAKSAVSKPGAPKGAPAKAEGAKSAPQTAAESSSGDEESSSEESLSSGSEASSSEEEDAKGAAQTKVKAGKSATSKPGATKGARAKAEGAKGAVSKPGATKGAAQMAGASAESSSSDEESSSEESESSGSKASSSEEVDAKGAARTKVEAAKSAVSKPGQTKGNPAKAEGAKTAVLKPGATKGAAKAATASAETSSGDEESSSEESGSSGSEASSSEDEDAKGVARTKVDAAKNAVSKPGATKGAPKTAAAAKTAVSKPGPIKGVVALAEKAAKSSVLKPGPTKGGAQADEASAESSSGEEESSSAEPESTSAESESTSEGSESGGNETSSSEEDHAEQRPLSGGRGAAARENPALAKPQLAGSAKGVVAKPKPQSVGAANGVAAKPQPAGAVGNAEPNGVVAGGTQGGRAPGNKLRAEANALAQGSSSSEESGGEDSSSGEEDSGSSGESEESEGPSTPPVGVEQPAASLSAESGEEASSSGEEESGSSAESEESGGPSSLPAGITQTAPAGKAPVQRQNDAAKPSSEESSESESGSSAESEESEESQQPSAPSAKGKQAATTGKGPAQSLNHPAGSSSEESGAEDSGSSAESGEGGEDSGSSGESGEGEVPCTQPPKAKSRPRAAKRLFFKTPSVESGEEGGSPRSAREKRARSEALGGGAPSVESSEEGGSPRSAREKRARSEAWASGAPMVGQQEVGQERSGGATEEESEDGSDDAPGQDAHNPYFATQESALEPNGYQLNGYQAAGRANVSQSVASFRTSQHAYLLKQPNGLKMLLAAKVAKKRGEMAANALPQTPAKSNNPPVDSAQPTRETLSVPPAAGTGALQGSLKQVAIPSAAADAPPVGGPLLGRGEVASIDAPKSQGGLELKRLDVYDGYNSRRQAVKNALHDFCNMLLLAEGQQPCARPMQKVPQPEWWPLPVWQLKALHSGGRATLDKVVSALKVAHRELLEAQAAKGLTTHILPTSARAEGP